MRTTRTTTTNQTRRIAFLGCGALGSQIAWNLAYPNHWEFILVDFDTIDQNNVETGTTVFSRQHIGASKVNALAEIVWRKGRVNCEVRNERMTAANIGRLWEGMDLVLDLFDNAASRRLTMSRSLPLNPPVMHVAVSGARTGQIAWNDRYEPAEDGPNPVCTHALGARILRMTSTVAAGAVESFFDHGRTEEVVITERSIIR